MLARACTEGRSPLCTLTAKVQHPRRSQEKKMDGGNWKEMFNAACTGDIELVRYHIARGVDVNYAHPEFLSTPLVACILEGQAEVALELLSHGALPNLHSEFDGKTPMQAAQAVGLTAVIERLRQLGIEAPPVHRPAPAGFLQRLLGKGTAS
jgi:uncharacterized protein